MKNYFSKVTHYKNYILIALLMTTIICLTTNPAILSLKINRTVKIKKQNTSQTQNHPTETPTPSQRNQIKSLLAAAIQVSQNSKPTAISTPTDVLTPTPTNTPVINHLVQTTPTTGQPEQSVLHPTQNIESTTTSTPTPTQTIETVTLQIQLPSSSVTTTIHLKPNENVCDILQEAKDETKITSLTFDDSYMSMMHSRYVKEINGYQNNWTFTVNGTSPLGCSLSTPQPNDTIIWKFN